ncbi:hypothetical protein [Kaistia sp. UC242_56]|uniref:hypothetical protein n=1 Tax=Kaistia sp. UC242_56 TaxID=3374625 RepID=UPI0037908134
MQPQDTVSSAAPSRRVRSKPAAVTNMRNEWLALARPRPNFCILFREQEVASGAPVLMMDICQKHSLLAPIEELIDRACASRPLRDGEKQLVYEVIRDEASSTYMIVETMGPADFVLSIAEGLVTLGLTSIDNC